MINYQFADLFNQSSIKKDIDMIYDSDSHITNSDVVGGSFSLNESAFATKELRFGSLVSSQMLVKLYNNVPNLLDKELDVSIVVDNATSNPLKIGKFKVLEDKPTTDRLYKQIKAYDALYEVINKNVVDWYESLTFPMTLKEFRDSFFAYLNITQVNTALVNDTVQIEKTITGNTISGQQVLSAICELNGAIGRMNRDGNFEYVMLDVNPSNRIVIDKIVSKSGNYEDFDSQPISKVQIRQTTDDIGAIVGENGNTYIVQDNFLVYGKSSADLVTIATRLLSIIEGITYTPFNIKAIYGNPCYEIGDAITVVTKNKTFNSYIFNRTLNGIQAMSDTIKADGVEYYTENINSVNVQIQQVKRQTNELSRTVEETKSTITSVETIANNATDLANEANKNANEALDNIEISATAEGNPITVTDSGNQPLIEFKEDGYIIQEGTPTPDAPVEIQGLGDDGNIEVLTTGKNIFGGLALANALVNSGSTNVVVDEENGTVRYAYNTNYQNSEKTVLFDKFKENTQYTFILKGKNDINRGNATIFTNLGVLYSDGTTESTISKLSTTGTGADFTIVYTTPKDKTIDIFRYTFGDNDTNILYYNQCGVFEGVITEDEFEPYQSTTANIPINAPLYEGDYIEIYSDGRGEIVRNKGKVVLDGSEVWTYQSSTSSYYSPIPSAKGTSKSVVYSNYFTYSDVSTEGTIRFGATNSNIVITPLLSQNIASVNDFKAWLQSNPIIVIYELKTPTETPLTAEQIAEIEKLCTFEPVTNVFAESNTYIRYYRNNTNADLITQANKNVLAKAQSSITQTANEIKLEVSKTYSTKTETTDLDNRLNDAESTITQNAEQIELKVSKGDVSSQLSVERGQVAIRGNRLVVDSDNFELDADGQWQVGDDEQYIKFFENDSGNKQLVINAQGVSVDENGSATINGTVYAQEKLVIGKIPEGNQGYIPPSGFTGSESIDIDTETVIKKYNGSFASNYSTGGAKTRNLITNGMQGKVGEFTDTLFGNKIYGNDIETLKGANLDELNDSIEFSTATKVRFAVNPTDGTLRIRLYIDDTNYYDLYATSNTFRFYKTVDGAQSEVWKITP